MCANSKDCGLQRLFINDRVPHGSLAVTRYDEITTDFFRYYKPDEKVSACRRHVLQQVAKFMLKACWPVHQQTAQWRLASSAQCMEAGTVSLLKIAANIAPGRC